MTSTVRQQISTGLCMSSLFQVDVSPHNVAIERRKGVKVSSLRRDLDTWFNDSLHLHLHLGYFADAFIQSDLQ
jgi:hypothetical protein